MTTGVGTAPAGVVRDRATVVARLADYVQLTKPRIVVLLLLTTAAAMVIAEGGLPSAGLFLATMAGGYLAAGGANAINQFIDRDIDAAMERTRDRPVVAGRISPAGALAFGVSLGLAAALLLGLVANWLTAALALAGLAIYVGVYTLWLKRRTAQNIVIGGAAGAVPPLVGWAAVTGELSLAAWLMFAIVFYWTPPHFWALALLLERDYASVRIPMLPVVVGDAETRLQIAIWSAVMVGVSVLPVAAGAAGAIYLAGALALGGASLVIAWATWRERESLRWARWAFHGSLAYLALIFIAWAIDAVAG